MKSNTKQAKSANAQNIGSGLRCPAGAAHDLAVLRIITALETEHGSIRRAAVSLVVNERLLYNWLQQSKAAPKSSAMRQLWTEYQRVRKTYPAEQNGGRPRK
jgi:hypothetical protein